MAVNKAVIPAAGRGTRFLPASKAIPKEMLPLVDRPVLQCVVEEAVAQGCDDIAVVVSEGKEAIERHFAPDPALEAFLEARGERAGADEVRRTSGLGPLTFLAQDEPLGLGHAVGLAEDFVQGESFAVLLGDDVCDGADSALPAMLALHERTGQSVVLLIDATPETIASHSSVDPVPLPLEDIPGAGEDPRIPSDARVYSLRRLNEKPAPGEEYSRLAVVGRYIFTPAIFDALRATEPGRNGEVQLTDAIDLLARRSVDLGGGVLGLVYTGMRHDAGDKLGYLEAVVDTAVQREDVGPAFLAWLRAYIETRET